MSPVLDLPRLLCLSDVPPAEGLGGALIVYRLLQSYPTSHLQVVDTSLAPSGAHRLPGVTYSHLYVGPRRLLTTRFAALYAGVLTLAARLNGRRLDRLVRAARVEAVVTVVQGFAWMSAADVAIRHGLPLHLLLHDDWESTHGLRQPFAGFAQQAFRRAYAYATSRLCVSPYMADMYSRRYGQTVAVLLPPRDVHTADPAEPAGRAREGEQVTFAYAGSLYTPAYAQAVAALGRALAAVGARLIIFSPQASAIGDLSAAGLTAEDIRPVLPANQLTGVLRREADVLFVPMSFAPWDRLNMMAGFPSKLADYTAVGLPLLIWGPDYCSAVRWGCENPGVAEVVSQQDEALLRRAVARLASDTGYRHRLALRALERGNQVFAHRVISAQFHDALRKGRA